jgi:GNAT superfamily N-acetyltransferase
MDAHTLVTPTTVSEWASYHTIRREVLFDARGLHGVYDENHPDEKAANHHPKLLLYGTDPVAVVRIDIDGAVAALRRVAVRGDVQRRGHGRTLLALAQRFAQEAGCSRLESFVAPDAVGFYERVGFTIEKEHAVGPSGRDSVFMAKPLA